MGGFSLSRTVKSLLSLQGSIFDMSYTNLRYMNCRTSLKNLLKKMARKMKTPFFWCFHIHTWDILGFWHHTIKALKICARKQGTCTHRLAFFVPSIDSSSIAWDLTMDVFACSRIFLTKSLVWQTMFFDSVFASSIILEASKFA